MGIYDDLGIEPVINAMGTVTIMGGSIMPEEVVQAMVSASQSFVDIYQLHLAAGRRIAQLVGVEAAHVCACASAGITLMAAACMAGNNPQYISQLPRAEGLKSIFIVQRPQRNGFDHGIEVAGGKLLEIEADEGELRTALSEQVAAVYYTHAWFITEKVLPLRVVVEAAHTKGIPVIVDAAAEVPPVENLSRFINEGADLVVFSGGKAIRGPQSSGVIFGRKDLVECCSANDSPNVNGIARGMKVGKEEIAGLVKAIELYVQGDHAAEMEAWDKKIAYLLGEFSKLPGVTTERQLPPGVGQQVPHLAMHWDATEMGVTCEGMAAALRKGKPGIAVRIVETKQAAGQTRQIVWVCVQTLRDGEEKVVARRIIEIFNKAATR